MSKKAIILLAEGFEEIEAITCIDVLRRGGIQVTITGLENIEVEGSRRIKVLADTIITQIDTEFDACILPGGMPGAENLSKSAEVNSLIKSMNQKEKIIAAICASPAVVLSPLGILKGRSATCYPGLEEKFEEDINYKEEKVVTDNNIITSQGPGTALSFALKIVEILQGENRSQRIKKATLSD